MTTENEQEALWNGPGGNAWVGAQAVIDRVLMPLERILVDAVAGPRVLDVGCGTGGTTVAIARALGSGGEATGIDISEPMVAAARERSRRDGVPAEFIRADAETHAFEPGSFDSIVSRFGVMFFPDPVRALSGLRAAAAPGGRLFCIVWRDPAENDFMTTTERAAAPFLPDLPEREPGAPGQFGWADPARVEAILTESGWTEIELQPLDVTLVLRESELGLYIERLGPVGRALTEIDEPKRSEIVRTVRAAFEPYVHGEEVRYTAACWGVHAQAPGGASG